MGELSKQELKKMIKLVKEFKGYTKIITKKMPMKITPNLLKSLKHLELALKTGKDIGDAMEATRTQIKLVENAISSACGLVLKEGKKQGIEKAKLDMDTVCQAKAFRSWQNRAVQFTVDPRVSDSVFSNWGKKHLSKLKKYYSDFDLWAKKAQKSMM